ncbi:MAG: flagellar basal body rod protein FlgB [Nitrospirae bacterium]|nr:MAG: flagellar basal body rod protein FlgB [Nitrospirota bacterium]
MDRFISRVQSLINFTMKRHKVLLGNLANADTPGYKAKDVSFENIVKDEIINLRKTSPMHISEADARGEMEVSTRDNSPWLDENDVEPDIEMAKITENALLNQTALRLMNERIKMYKMLLNGR